MKLGTNIKCHQMMWGEKESRGKAEKCTFLFGVVLWYAKQLNSIPLESKGQGQLVGL